MALCSTILAPLPAAAVVTDNCRECVMKCVMEEGKFFKACVRLYPTGKEVTCDKTCSAAFADLITVSPI